MNEFEHKLDELLQRLDGLQKSQELVRKEIGEIKGEIDILRNFRKDEVNVERPEAPAKYEKLFEKPAEAEPRPQIPIEENSAASDRHSEKGSETAEENFENPVIDEDGAFRQPALKNNLERFIGENLISKIGIVILILGVAIGAKYAIDNNLISPLTRIVIGYGVGFGLLGFAYKLRTQYLNFSAVLLSGAMAIMYFLTYFAHALYEIFSQTTAFVMMLIFTAFTVAAAISYSRQVIANIGLVGAYTIPFLLSNNSGNVTFLFSYVAIINIGILFISVKKYWRSLFYLSFIFTWLIFAGWYVSGYSPARHFNLALLFLFLNFFIFYITFLAKKIISRQKVGAETILLTISNAFIFYGLGYSILESREEFENYTGLFTIGNAFLHFGFAYFISRLKDAPRELVYLVTALVLIFLTIAVPVQLDGQVVTLVWAAEAAALFWFGRAKQIPLFEFASLGAMMLALLSLLLDWQTTFYYQTAEQIIENYYPFYNGIFVTSLIFAAIFAFIFAVNRDRELESAVTPEIRKALDFIIPAIGLLVLYNGIRMEIGNYFFLRYLQSATDGSGGWAVGNLVYDNDLLIFSFIWQLNFTMLFVTILSLVNNRKFKSLAAAITCIVLSFLTLSIFLTAGLYFLGELRQSYLQAGAADVFQPGSIYIVIRYISLLFVAGLIYSVYRSLGSESVKSVFSQTAFVFDAVFYISLLLILTAELISWTQIFGFTDSYKLVTSIFWGVYAVGLIVIGIYQNKKYLRIGAISLFAVTLAKLSFFDIAELGTLSKTVVFVSLGILLLIASFLYNKYKAFIFESP